MASYLPPTETLPIFDNSVFDSNNSTALTYATAKKYFLTFPSAQGTSTITDFIAGSIAYLSPASGSFFNIGTNQVLGGTIRIGPTGTSGVSVHAGNIDCTNNTINNATASDTGNISLCNLQTSGVLNIGTGVRTSAINIGNNTSASNTGGVNVGSRGSSGSGGGPLNLYGTTIDINCSNITTAPMTLTTYVNNPITIGAAGNLNLNSTNAGNVYLGATGSSSVSIGSLSSPSTPTTVNGTLTTTGLLTANGGLTIGGTNGITLPTTTTTPTSTQLGYNTSVTNSAQVDIGTGSSGTILTTGATIPIGIYIVNISIAETMNPNTTSSSTSFSYALTNMTFTGSLASGLWVLNCTGSTLSNKYSFTTSVIAKVTASSGTITLSGQNSASCNCSFVAGQAIISYIKIA